MRRKKPKVYKLGGYPSYKGGHTVLHGGYIWEFAPHNHMQNMWGWVAQHRLIGEDIKGSPLIRGQGEDKNEVVHHKDNCRTNNSLDNLEVMIQRQHRIHHAQEKSRNSRAATMTSKEVVDGLVGRTIKEAATFLGVDHNTLRNRFPDEIAHRKRKTGINTHCPKSADLVRPFAPDKSKGLREAAAALGITQRSVQIICKRHNIEWTPKEPEIPLYATSPHYMMNKDCDLKTAIERQELKKKP